MKYIYKRSCNLYNKITVKNITKKLQRRKKKDDNRKRRTNESNTTPYAKNIRKNRRNHIQTMRCDI